MNDYQYTDTHKNALRACAKRMSWANKTYDEIARLIIDTQWGGTEILQLNKDGKPNKTAAKVLVSALRVAKKRIKLIEDTRKLCPPESTIYSIIRHVSASGMRRRIDFYVVRNEELVRISWHIARILGYSQYKYTTALVVDGCGMDMAYHVVHSLSYAIHGYDYRCPEDRVRPGYTLSSKTL